jgi:N-acyl homoserine lactone hydrolase
MDIPKERNDLSVQVLLCGEVGVDPTVPHRSLSHNPLAFTGLFRSKKKRIYLPVKCFLIRMPSGKSLLVDTAWDSRVREHPITTLTYPMWFASKPLLKEGEAIDEQLRCLGISPRDLEAVILTHLDIDHVSGLRLVKDAPKIYASAEEKKEAYSLDLRYARKPLKGIPIQSIPWNTQEGPYQRSYAILGMGASSFFSRQGIPGALFRSKSKTMGIMFSLWAIGAILPIRGKRVTFRAPSIRKRRCERVWPGSKSARTIPPV